MDFTPFDKDSSTWQKLKAHYESRLNWLRHQNDQPMMEDRRNHLLGQIFEVKALLALEQVPLVTPNQGFAE